MVTADTVALRLGEVQQSAVEINIADPAHDEEREDWWPQLVGSSLSFRRIDADAVAAMLNELSNDEDDLVERGPIEGRKDAKAARDALFTLAVRVRRVARRAAA